MNIIKLVLRWVGAVIIIPLSLLLGMVVGAAYGGNYDVSFYFASVAGYEAWGLVVAQLFGSVGLALSAMLVVPKKWQLQKKIVWLAAVFSNVLALACLLYSDTYSTTPWLVLLLPILCTATLLYVYYFFSAKARYWLYGLLLGSTIILAAFLVYTLQYNYACLRSAVICFVEAPTVTAVVKQNPATVNTPVKFISDVTLYGDIYTLEKYCSDLALVWNFGDGETVRKTGCDSYPPMMQSSTRGWVKHTYARAGNYQVGLEFIYRGRALSHATTTVVVQ
ncbi:MAG: PKD domain-containing protein [Candidatus Kerfeldbacteria bacterium]|nr:PKD domain-containing protein [Candidatus Kerfeldbacteria bacterium]